MADKVTIRIDGDASGATAAFQKAGAESRSMAADIDGAADTAEGRFRGLGDTIGGTGDIMEGFRTGNVALLAMGFADLAGGVKDFILPAITSLSTALKVQLGSAMTFISAHPLFAALLVGGAIIGGLILLEKKFGIVTKAVKAVKEAASAVFDWFLANWDDLANIVTFPFRAAFEAIARLWNASVGKLSFKVPSWVPGIGGNGFDVPNIPIPKFHTGGIAGRDTLALLQAGETVIPRGQSMGSGITINVGGSVITERDFGRLVADALRNNRLIGVTA